MTASATLENYTTLTDVTRDPRRGNLRGGLTAAMDTRRCSRETDNFASIYCADTCVACVMLCAAKLLHDQLTKPPKPCSVDHVNSVILGTRRSDRRSRAVREAGALVGLFQQMREAPRAGQGKGEVTQPRFLRKRHLAS